MIGPILIKWQSGILLNKLCTGLWRTLLTPFSQFLKIISKTLVFRRSTVSKMLHENSSLWEDDFFGMRNFTLSWDEAISFDSKFNQFKPLFVFLVHVFGGIDSFRRTNGFSCQRPKLRRNRKFSQRKSEIKAEKLPKLFSVAVRKRARLDSNPGLFSFRREKVRPISRLFFCCF